MDAAGTPQAQAIPFRFTGKAGQYFGIWIVNILLTIITLGIYAPWAKVRTKRYFYGHTQLAGAAFDYLANPVTILKGWAIAVAVLIIYNLVSGMFPIMELVFFILFMLALPWIVVRSLAFRARNSAYRNIRFTFDKAYREAIRVFILNALLVPLTLGLALPYYIYSMNRFMVNNSGYGTTGFNFHGSAKDFYKVYLMAGLMLAGFVAVAAAIVVPLTKDMATQFESAVEYDPAELNAAPFGADIDLHQQAPADEGGSDSNAEFYFDEDGNLVIPEGQGDFVYDEDDYVFSEEEIQMDPAAMQMAMAIQFGIMLAIAAFYLFAFAFLQARIGNLVFNKMELDGHRFFSVLRARDLMWLYASNAVAIMLSFGLLIPWARVRMARYRADRLALLASGDLDNFAQAQQDKVSATGEELGEVFDVDIGL